VLGLALGGFFDGILLHQILQWHHLLSLVPGSGDLRMQVIWDGWFHALMYLVAALGLWGLWRAHGRGQAGSGRQLLGGVLLGFSAWQAADIVIFHWLMGMHRVRLDTPSPLAWDLGWFAAFGLVPLLAAMAVMRRPAVGGATPLSALVLLTLGAAGAGAWNLQPSGQGLTTVAFRPGLSQQEVMGAIVAADARLVWSDAAMGVVVVSAEPGRRWQLYRHGALMVSGAGAVAACFGWSRT